MAINLFAPLQLRRFAERDLLDNLVSVRQRACHIFVQDTNAAGRNRADGELFKAGDAELADDENIERDAQPSRDFKRDRHTTARQSKHDDVVSIRISQELLREKLPGFRSI